MADNGEPSAEEQAAALGRFAHERALPGGVKPEPVPRPKLKLPGDNVTIGGFAQSFWTFVKDQGVFRRDSMAVHINPESRRYDFFDPHMVQVWGDENVDCYKTRVKMVDEQPVFTDVSRSMPVDIAKSCLAKVKVSPELLSPIERVNQCPLPILRGDGTIGLLAEGYDKPSRTFTFPAGFELQEMTLMEAHDHIRHVHKEFPFGDGADNPERSIAVQVACLLTLFAGGLLPKGASRPLFVFNANTPRSGKSLLAKVNLISIFGEASSSSWSENTEEFRKSLETAANTASPYVFYDNVRHYMANADLERFVTSPSVSCRVMGKNTELLVVPNVATVLITANGARCSPDIAERALFVNLFVDEADPQARKIKAPLDEAQLSDYTARSLMLSALWRFVRNWDEAKRPRCPSVLAGFESWSQIIGGIVMASGFTNPLERPKIEGIGDTRGQQMEELVGKMWSIAVDDNDWDDGDGSSDNPQKLANGRSYTFMQLCTLCAKEGLYEDFIPDSGEIKQKERSSFGKLLKKYTGRGRVFTIKVNEGTPPVLVSKRVRLENNAKKGRAQRWLVLDASQPT